MTYLLAAHAIRQMQVDCLSCFISPQVLLEFIPAFVLFPFELFCLNLPQDYTSIHGQGSQLSCYCTFSFYSQVPLDVLGRRGRTVIKRVYHIGTSTSKKLY